MPTIKRRRREQRTGKFYFGSEQWQTLMYGCIMIRDVPDAGKPFENDGEMRSVWREHRAVLLAEFETPGQRPFGYWKHDIGVIPDPFGWPGELMALLDRRLVTAEEAVRLEHMRQMLAAEQGSFCSSFDDPALIRHLGLGSEHMAREFDAAAKFHAWRNRAELADVYAERAAKVRGNCRNEF